MPEIASPAPHPPQPLCRSEDLAERGRGVAFDVVLWRQPARGFALRIDGRVVAYVNRCSHVPTELDWNPGEFLDAQGQHIVCAVHGAQYSPTTGACLGGPCGRGRLMAVSVSEDNGQVHWYPSRDIAPVVFDVDGRGAADPANTEPPTP